MSTDPRIASEIEAAYAERDAQRAGRSDSAEQARRDRLDAQDAAAYTDPPPSAAEMTAARGVAGWSQGMEAQPYRVGFPAENRAEWVAAAGNGHGEGRAR